MVVKSWHVYLAHAMKHLTCEGSKITTVLTLTNIVIFFPLAGFWSPKVSLTWEPLYPHTRNQRPKVKPTDSRFTPYS